MAKKTQALPACCCKVSPSSSFAMLNLPPHPPLCLGILMRRCLQVTYPLPTCCKLITWTACHRLREKSKVRRTCSIQSMTFSGYCTRIQVLIPEPVTFNIIQYQVERSSVTLKSRKKVDHKQHIVHNLLLLPKSISQLGILCLHAAPLSAQHQKASPRSISGPGNAQHVQFTSKAVLASLTVAVHSNSIEHIWHANGTMLYNVTDQCTVHRRPQPYWTILHYRKHTIALNYIVEHHIRLQSNKPADMQAQIMQHTDRHWSMSTPRHPCKDVSIYASISPHIYTCITWCFVEPQYMILVSWKSCVVLCIDHAMLSET